MPHTPRILIIGDGAAALSTTERLLRAGMCVDLVSERPAPFGLLRRFAGLSGNREDISGGRCGSHSQPRLRLIGNVRIGHDITHRELHQLAASGDRELILLELAARGIPITTWEGLCTPPADNAPTDWSTITTRAQLAPVCF